MKKFFGNKDALLLWGSRSFSRFGDSLEMLALLYLIYDLTGSGLAMGSLMLFSVLPNAIVSPFAGVIADRYDKRKIMFISELTRTLCIILIPILMVTNVIRVWQIYLISIVVSIAESFFEPTAGIAFVLVVGKKHMPEFNSIVTISNHIMRVLGYSLSGIMIATVGKELIFVIDGITFLASAIVALLVTIPKTNKECETQTSDFRGELSAGFKYVKSSKIILPIMFVIFMIQFLGTPLDTYIPIIIDKILRVSKIWSGYFATATIIGAILGNILYPILNKTSIKLYHMYLLGIMAMAISIGGSGYILSPIYYTFMFFIVGLVSSLLGTWSFTEIQIRSDTEYLGRVGSIMTMLMLIPAPLAGVIFGGLADIVYIPTIFKNLSVAWVITAIVSSIVIKNAFSKTQLKKAI